MNDLMVRYSVDPLFLMGLLWLMSALTALFLPWKHK